jgi:hypothetical protein
VLDTILEKLVSHAWRWGKKRIVVVAFQSEKKNNAHSIIVQQQNFGSGNAFYCFNTIRTNGCEHVHSPDCNEHANFWSQRMDTISSNFKILFF